MSHLDFEMCQCRISLSFDFLNVTCLIRKAYVACHYVFKLIAHVELLSMSPCQI